jgi:hypothetical protein
MAVWTLLDGLVPAQSYFAFLESYCVVGFPCLMSFSQKRNAGGNMKFHSSWMTAVAGAALFAIAAAPPAFAKKNKNSGSVTVGCLTTDTDLQTALGITDGSAPVSVTVSPGFLWPPNHKMQAESFSVQLTPTSPSLASPYSSGADITVWLVGLTDDQASDDDAGGHGCGAPSAKQGPDWSPGIDFATPGTYISGSATLTDSSPGAALSLTDQSGGAANVALRSERCARDGTRTYTVSVVCCDTTFSPNVCDDAAFVSPPPTAAPTPANTEDLNVEVLKSRGHHGKP